MTNVLFSILCAAGFSIGLWIGGFFIEDEPAPCTTYNEMRQIHRDTNGEYGWPAGAIKGCER